MSDDHDQEDDEGGDVHCSVASEGQIGGITAARVNIVIGGPPWSSAAQFADRVERHTEAYRRWRKLFFSKGKSMPADEWAAFMNEMEDWFAENRLYLNEKAAEAFRNALTSRAIIDVGGDGPVTIQSEEFKVIRDAGQLILDNSPRYGSVPTKVSV